MAGWKERLRAKPFVFWMAAAGLVYMGLGVLGLYLSFGPSPTDPFLLIIGIIAAVAVLAAYGCYVGKRWGFVASIIVMIVMVLLISFVVVSAYANPAYPGAWLVESGFPIIFLVLGLSILALRRWKTGVQNDRNLTSLHSTGGIVSIATLGFAIGSLVVGVAAAPLIVNLVAGSGETADIRIVPNAASAAVPYAPGNYSVVRGPGGNVTVTWFNGDTNDHTVTSDSGPFSSPFLGAGARFSFTFTQAGTYPYHCEPHPNMRGTVVVA